MEQENSIKDWLTATVFEHSCKNNFSAVIERIFKDQELSSNLHINFVENSETQRVKPIFLLIHILRKLLFAVESFALEITSGLYSWNSDILPNIIKLLEATFKQNEFISVKKFFSLLLELKFLDMMHLLRINAESSVLMQKLNIHFPRWHPSQKVDFEKQFSIENTKILDKVEESCIQCRRLILKLAADPKYRSVYMSEQFSNDMKKMMIDSVIHLNEVINNLSANSGLTLIEKRLNDKQMSSECEDLGYQLLLDYLQPCVSSEVLLKFLDEMEPALAPPSGGFSSCLLPFDTVSECSEAAMDSEYDENDSESSEGSSNEADKTITHSNEDN